MSAALGAHRPLKVVHLIDNLSSKGGAQQSIVALAPGMVASGIDLSVASLGPNLDLAAALEADGIATVCLAGRGGRAADVVRTIRLLRRERPDLLHTSLHGANLVGRIAAALTRVPVVVSMVSTHHDAAHMARPTRWGAAKARLSTFVDRHSMRSVRRVHAVSNAVAQELVDHFRMPRERIDVIARGRDPRRFGGRDQETRSAARATLGLPAEALVVLAVGRQHPVKGYDVLLPAVPAVREQFPAVRVLIAGDADRATPVLQHLVSELELGDAVVFLGHCDDIPALHRVADVFVLSSRVEGMPGALIEALAMGTPIVATDIAPALEVVDDTCAIVVPVDSSAAIAQAITSVFRDPAAGAARAEVGRARFDERFRLDAVSRQMAEFYRRALA